MSSTVIEKEFENQEDQKLNESAYAYGFGPYFTKKEMRNLFKDDKKYISCLSFVKSPNRPMIQIKFKTKLDCIKLCRKFHGNTFTLDKNEWALSLIRCSSFQSISSRDVADRSRIIVRNLKFKITENDVRNKFKLSGPIHSINLPITAALDGKARQVGCGFIQFYHPIDAARAISQFNGTELHGRIIAVDWSVPKEKYKENAPSIKKVTPFIDDTINDIESINKKSLIFQKDQIDITEPLVESVSKPVKPAITRVEKLSDVKEGKTIFITNLSYDVTEQKLKEFMENKFGQVVYATLMKDRVTSFPKGCAFVKFSEKAATEASIKASGTNVVLLNDLMMNIRLALTKEDLKHVDKDVPSQLGTIEGIKSTDDENELRRRRRSANESARKLKDSNYFVSSKRLSIRNLPILVDEKTIKSSICNALQVKGDTFDVIIRRNKFRQEPIAARSNVGKQRGRSMGYGFIKCSDTKLANDIITSLNGKPSKAIFGKPEYSGNLIVEYSVENKDKLTKSSIKKY